MRINKRNLLQPDLTPSSSTSPHHFHFASFSFTFSIHSSLLHAIHFYFPSVFPYHSPATYPSHSSLCSYLSLTLPLTNYPFIFFLYYPTIFLHLFVFILLLLPFPIPRPITFLKPFPSSLFFFSPNHWNRSYRAKYTFLTTPLTDFLIYPFSLLSTNSRKK